MEDKPESRSTIDPIEALPTTRQRMPAVAAIAAACFGLALLLWNITLEVRLQSLGSDAKAVALRADESRTRLTTVDDSIQKLEARMTDVEQLVRNARTAIQTLGNVSASIDDVRAVARGASSAVASLESYIDRVAGVARDAHRLATNANNYAHSHGYSDERLKTSVSPYTSGAHDVSRMRVVTYTWRSGAPGGVHVGVLAQDLLPIAPHLVSTDTQGILHVDYAGLTPILLQTIQDQQAQIDALESRLKALEQR